MWEAEKSNNALPEKIRFPQYEKHPRAFYYSKSIPTISKLSQDSWEYSELENEIKKIEKEINLSFKNELKELMKDFIKINQKAVKEMENEEVGNEVEGLEEKLKEKLREANFSEEDIREVIRCCEKIKVIDSNQQKEESQAKIIDTFPRNNY